MKKRVLTTVTALVLTFMVLFLAACSQQSTTSSTSAPSTTAPASTSNPVTTSSAPTTTAPATTTSQPTATTSAPVSTTSAPTTTSSAAPTSTSAGTSTFKLTFATSGSRAMATYTMFLKPYQDAITEQTNGRVTWTTYDSETLLKQPDEYDGVMKGIVDMSYAPSNASPGLFPGFEVFSLPLLAVGEINDHTALITQVYNDNKDLQDEMSGTKVMGFFGTAPYQIHTTKKPVRALQDLKGMRIGGPSSSQVFPSSWGVIPVQITAGDMYSSLDKGVVDGVVLPWGVLSAFGLSKLTHYHTICNIGSVSQWMSMNWNTWNSLPPDIQAVFEKNKPGTFWPPAVDIQTKKAIDDSNAYGYEIITLSQDEISKWFDAAKDTWNKWVSDITPQVPGAQAILDETFQLVQHYNALEAAASTTTTP